MTSTYDFSQRQRFMDMNRMEYGPWADDINWVSPDRAMEAHKQRDRNLASMADALVMDCLSTKPRLGPLSPGCVACTQGRWSCLFINGKCNCRCFYCPAPQDDIGAPTTNRILFHKPFDYALYVDHFGFTGVSISGGEPLLTLNRTLSYIQAVRRISGDKTHIWMYTNGALLTAEKLKSLRDAGLNEIRFDISAVDYDLKKAALAPGLIPCVTVEIPALAEDKSRLINLLPTLRDLGVNHLNLHQLRLTPHNREFMKTHDYNYLHGEKVTVLDSELAALDILQAAVERGINLPINYCAFVYKHQFQRTAARRRNAAAIVKPHEAVTEGGYIRSLALSDSPGAIDGRVQSLIKQQLAPHLWCVTGKKDKLYFHPTLWRFLDVNSAPLFLSYAEAVLTPHISYHNPFKAIRLKTGMSLYVEKQPSIKTMAAPDELKDYLAACVMGTEKPTAPVESEALRVIRAHEKIRPGLQTYF